MDDQRNVIVKRSIIDSIQQVPKHISQVVEHFFYQVGFRIAQKPKKWLIGCSLVVLICIGGLFRFRQEKNPLRLWMPPDSDFVSDTEWLMSHFDEGIRTQIVIMTGEDLLEPKALYHLNEITKELLSTKVNNPTQITWTDVCFKVPMLTGVLSRPARSINDDFFEEEPEKRMNKTSFNIQTQISSEQYCNIVNSLPKACLLHSILDIWKFNSTLIASATKNEIIDLVNSINISPTLGHPINFTEYLGGVTRDENQRIISAKAIKTTWPVHVDYTNINMNEIGNDAGTADWATEDVLQWELEFLKKAEKSAQYLENAGIDAKLWYEAARSFGDVSSNTLFQDLDKVFIGGFLMMIYVQAILSRCNWVEWRFCLTISGLLCIGGAFIIAVGVCSMLGISYGPVHTSLPFLLMGLGVDDIFIMMASWEQIHSYEDNRRKSLEEKVGLMLSHAGSAICITSLTDVVAFIIGASTILPSLESYCIYAAVGVLVNFLLQVTFFVGFFTLDQRRVESKRNGFIPCIVHENHRPSTKPENDKISWRILDFIYSKIVLTTPGKIIVVLITIALTSAGAFGAWHLEQWFEPEWFIQEGSYLNKYIHVSNEYYSSRGFSGSVFMKDNNYSEIFPKILDIETNLKNMSIIESVVSWPSEFADYVDVTFEKDVRTGAMSHNDFGHYLSMFLFSQKGGKYQGNFQFRGTLQCGIDAPTIKIASLDFVFIKFESPSEWIPAMDNTKLMMANSDVEGFVWSKVFGTWVTDKVIAQEVTRNVMLALICVMGTTAVLIAEPQTCFWILTCVLLTLLDVCGFMFYWGLTIDLVSCIALELAVGLSVDYAAHVAHSFLNVTTEKGSKDRTGRTLIAVRHIGAAVIYGAGSTLLAISLMGFSQSYVFRAFLKIFFLVITIGLWHGLILLPVILSTLGPMSLENYKPKASVCEVEKEIELREPLNK